MQPSPHATAAEGRLSPTAREALSSIGRRRRFDSGVTLLVEGEGSDAFYLVLAGQVKMSRLTPAGKNLILALFGPGDVFGIANALGGEVCGSSMQAMVPSECLEVRRRDLYDLFTRQPQLVPEVLPALTRHLMECKNCLVEASCSRVETRFAQLFLKLAETMGQRGEQGELIPLPLSRQELADLTGTTIETAIRVMSRWGKDGVIETRRDGFLLTDRRALEKLSWE
ncbi:MAG TPA: Crp/Fnr family transcriptional regulator [Thermoanaerobaculia bacterium]|nr:Crp/Fnr family transcriptional regulator [Thermoanaerobaculia bacterium]